jgi:hypothetical protein
MTSIITKKLNQTFLIAAVLVLSACEASRFTSVFAPDLVPAAELAKFRCAELNLPNDKECLMRQHEQIIIERAEIRKAEAGATRTTNTTNVEVINKGDKQD